MITKITGQLASLHGDTLTLKIDAFEYEVLIPECNRRQLQSELGRAVSLHRSNTWKVSRCRGG